MRSRTRAILARAAKRAALGGIFVTAALGGLVLHANRPEARRMLASIANEPLSSTFQGRIVVGEITTLSLGRTTHAHVAEASILDPDGRRVILAKDIDARIDLARLLGALAHGRPPDIAIEGATIDDAEVVLDRDAGGEMVIARTFAARASKTQAPPTAATSPSRETLALSITKIRVHHAHVHGNVVPPLLDGDADAVEARLAIKDDLLTVALAGAQATLRAPRVPGQEGHVHGRATGSLAVPLRTPADAANAITMHWKLDGDGAGIPLKAQLDLDGDKLDAKADIASVQPDVVKRAFPALRVAQPVEVHATATGTLPVLDVHVVTDGRLVADGQIDLRGDQPFHLEADLVRIDSAAFEGPTSDVSGHVHVEGAIAHGAPAGTFRLATRPATIRAQRAPAIDAEGAFDLRHVTASLRASEPGVDLDGTAELHIPEETLTFDLHARSRELRLLARAPGVVSGSATAHAVGTVDLARASIEAHVTADGASIARAPAAARSVHAEATVTGPLADPLLDVTARAAEVRLSAAGRDNDQKEPLTYRSASAHARVTFVPSLRVVGGSMHVDAAEDGASIDAKADAIELGPDGVDVRGGRITGLGAPLDLDVQVAPGTVTLRAKGKDLEMRRVAAMTGIKELRMLPEDARGAVDIDVKAMGARADGHFDLSVAAKDGSAAEVHAKLDGRHVVASGRVAVGTLGWVEMPRAELDLPGAPSVSAFERATGVVDLRGELDLSQGAALLGGENIEQLSGRALLSARIERADARTAPSITATARTQALDITLDREGVSTHIGGLDVAIHGAYDGASNETEGYALVWDAKGVVGSADGKARVPLFAWLTGAERPDRGALAAIELGALVDVPRRSVADLPGVFARPDLRGVVGARAALAGTLAHPDVTFIARANDLVTLQGARADARLLPVDGVLEARWNGTDAIASLRLDEEERDADPRAKGHPDVTSGHIQKKSGHARSLVIARVPVADLLASRPVAWNASAEVDITDLELAPLPLPLALGGVLTSHIKMRDLTGAAVLDGRARVDDLGVAGARVKRGDVRIEAKNGSLTASARIRQEDGGNGSVKIASSSLEWHGTELGWDPNKPTRIDYAVDRMQLAVLRPLVRRVIPEIDGRVDGRGSAVVDAETHVFEGGISLSEGRLYVNAIGEEVSDVSAIARFERNGVFRIVDATGKVGAGEIKASATGRMKGLRFESAEAVVVIPTKDGVPLSAEGATFAQATGEVRLTATRAPATGAMLVTVAVPRARVVVPDRGTQKLQSLDPDEAITIGIRGPDGTLVAPTLSPGAARRAKESAAAAAKPAKGEASPGKELTARFAVALGNEVELEGRGLRLGLGGKTTVDITDDVTVSGQITLKNGGTIDVQGRKFVVDRGTVTFIASNNPADPIVAAAAYWDAPDGTRVWVEFNGPLKTGKLTLRSEPPFSKNEILSILLFGRPDPNQATQGERPSDAQQATALGTGVVSAGLNKALGELDEDFDLEQDKTSANRVRTKVGYRLRRNLKVQIGYASGVSQREPDTTYLFLEWQFVPKWSLISTEGDRGTSILDLLFQHRY